jgi:hypothetical protein
MMTRPLRLAAAILAVTMALAMGCKPTAQQPETKMNPRFTVAVAPFTVAHEPSDLLAGYLPPNATPPKGDTQADLDAILTQVLNATPDRNIITAGRTKVCAESTRRDPEGSRLATITYWQNVGKCMDANFILVPMIVHWSERQGSAAGSTSPAWIVMDLYLVNVKTGGLVNHFHYDYQQQALTDNFLDLGQFLKRRGQWVTASDLAREALAKGVKEFGL